MELIGTNGFPMPCWLIEACHTYPRGFRHFICGLPGYLCLDGEVKETPVEEHLWTLRWQLQVVYAEAHKWSTTATEEWVKRRAVEKNAKA